MGALLPDPPVWILDEPMTGLDPKASWLLKQSMRRHADAGKTVLFSTHVLDVAEKVVDRVGVIADGELLFVGTVDEMREHFKAGDGFSSRRCSWSSPRRTRRSQTPRRGSAPPRGTAPPRARPAGAPEPPEVR